jgi:hypothetical protein
LVDLERIPTLLSPWFYGLNCPMVTLAPNGLCRKVRYPRRKSIISTVEIEYW